MSTLHHGASLWLVSHVCFIIKAVTHEGMPYLLKQPRRPTHLGGGTYLRPASPHCLSDAVTPRSRYRGSMNHHASRRVRGDRTRSHRRHNCHTRQAMHVGQACHPHLDRPRHESSSLYCLSFSLTFGVEQSQTAWSPLGAVPIHSGTSSQTMVSSSLGSEQKNQSRDGSGASASSTM